jgi:ACS family tartrate transporter-like MFS transporter
MNDVNEIGLMRRVAWKLLPFLGLCYFVAFVDRVNIGIASLTMNAALGLSATAYGMGAGIFFIGYFFFEVPSNLALRKVGARRWIARIMITWGIVTACTSLVHTAWSFYRVRFLLGAAEAGFFPGILFYMTGWFPATYRGRVTGIFMACAAGSSIVAPPISAYLLLLNGTFGLAGWQWLFVVEGAVSIAVGILCLWLLIDRPADAKWLADGERAWLEQRLESERVERAGLGNTTLRDALTNPHVLVLCAVSFGLILGTYSIGFWGPLILKSLGNSIVGVAYISSVISLCGVVAMVAWSRHSDAQRERTWHLVLPIAVACIGFLIAGTSLAHPVIAIVGLCLASAGIGAAAPVFWTFPTSFLTAVAAAGGLAFINSVGNLAGYFGPAIIGVLKDATGGFSGALIVIAACELVTCVIAYFLARAVPRDPGMPAA